MKAFRERLQDRRPHWLYRFECGGQHYTGGIGRFEDGRIAEVFINGAKVGSAAESNAQDAAIGASLGSSMAARWKPSATFWSEPVVQAAHWRRCWMKLKGSQRTTGCERGM